MQPGDARRFRTGRPCLDLVHTGGSPEYGAPDLVRAPADVAELLPVLLRIPGLDVPVGAGDLDPFRSLRGAVTRIAFALLEGGAPAPDDVQIVNAVAASPPLVPALRPDGVRVVDPTAAQALATLARDAVDLFGGPLRDRIRVCSADDCGLLYVDASRPGTRRWCSMQRCGTRAKVRGHRAREAGS